MEEEKLQITRGKMDLLSWAVALGGATFLISIIGLLGFADEIGRQQWVKILTGLLGGVIGYYFRSRPKGKEKE